MTETTASTVEITNAISQTQFDMIMGLLSQTVSAIASVIFTYINTMVTFFLKPSVLGTVVVLILLGAIYGAIRKKFMRRTFK